MDSVTANIRSVFQWLPRLSQLCLLSHRPGEGNIPHPNHWFNFQTIQATRMSSVLDATDLDLIVARRIG